MYGNEAFSSGIQRTAQSLGMDPVDLATIISYETAGTFSPTQRGPTTQWGQHRGLIQFGEPQARQYGVNWDDPMNSQLGEDGAVARYFRSNGWQPGMGLLDAYSIVNAGGPGLYNRSDANNGGAPGTVADKVNEQMGGHRDNALRLLGQTGQPAPQNGVTATMSTRNMQPPMTAAAPPVEEGRESIWKRMGVFKDDDRREKLAMAMAGMTLNPNEGLMRGLDASISARAKGRAETKAQQEQAAQRNQTAEWLRSNGSSDLADAVMGGMIDGAGAYNAHLQRQQGVAGPEMPASVVEAQWRAEQAGLVPGTPEYQEFVLNGGGDPATFRALDMQARSAGYQPGTPEYQQFMATRGAGDQAFARTSGTNLAEIETGGRAAETVAAGSARGTRLVESEAKLAEAERSMPALMTVVDRLDELSNVATFGAAQVASDDARRALGQEVSAGGVARAEYIAIVDNQILPLLRQTFGAAFTEAEGARLRATLGNEDGTPAERQATLRAFIEQKQRELDALRGSARPAPQVEGFTPAPQAPAGGGSLTFNPATGGFD